MSQGNISELIFKKQQDNRPYISVNILDLKCDGLLDSGASNMVVNAEFANKLKRLEVNTQRIKPFYMSTADGTGHGIRKTFDVPVQFNNQFHIMSILLMPNLNQPLILGKDFFVLFGISFKFESEILSNKPAIHAILEQQSALISKANLNEDQQHRLMELINEIRCNIGNGLGRTIIIKHTIDTGDS